MHPLPHVKEPPPKNPVSVARTVIGEKLAKIRGRSGVEERRRIRERRPKDAQAVEGGTSFRRDGGLSLVPPSADYAPRDPIKMVLLTTSALQTLGFLEQLAPPCRMGVRHR